MPFFVFLVTDDRTLHITPSPHIHYTTSLAPVSSHPVSVAAIDFLNPAPLMWDFEHPPRSFHLSARYRLHYTMPSLCAEDLLAGRADLGLIPIASITPDLAIVPGCTIASLDHVRSIQLIVKTPHTLETVRTVATDSASRSSRAYAQILFRDVHRNSPTFIEEPAAPIVMLRHHDAALVIGDPALLALEARHQIEGAIGPCQWFDLAHEWRTHTGLPWVAAVWAVRPEALTRDSVPAPDLIDDLTRSRDHGLAHIGDLADEWAPRIALTRSTIHRYLTENIHYTLTTECVETIRLFRRLAAGAEILPPLPDLRFL
ncbi:MAG: menaquinone biosynthesis protein [Acidobacteria bacterium]|nr:menaquinone biosynthesis protein [Acidobacteriota bacterium]